MEFSDRIKLPEPVRPALDALLGLNIDLALDAIVIRLGMWTWGVIGINDQWFGVPSGQLLGVVHCHRGVFQLRASAAALAGTARAGMAVRSGSAGAVVHRAAAARTACSPTSCVTSAMG